jgi:hypothetical protein
LFRLFGQPKFLLHDGLAAGIMNVTYNSATGALEPWDRVLGNSQDIVDLMLLRMRRDFEALNPKMRKPWNQTQLESSLLT